MKHLLLFEELFISSKPSNSGSSVSRDIVIDDEPSSSKTLSSSILLNDKLRKEELYSMISDAEESESTKAKDNLKVKNKKKWAKFKVTLNNLKFLKERLKVDKILKCEYCDKTPLIIYDPFRKGKNERYLKYGDFKPINGATADHKNPMAKGGDKFDFNNLAVSCMKCNHDKKEMDYEDWISLIKKEE